MHVAGEREERVPLAVAQAPDEVAAVPPGARAGRGAFQPRLERGRVRRRVRRVGRGHDHEQPGLGARRRVRELVQRDHVAGVAVEVAPLGEPLGEFLVRAEVAAVRDHQVPVRAGLRDLGRLAPFGGGGGRTGYRNRRARRPGAGPGPDRLARQPDDRDRGRLRRHHRVPRHRRARRDPQPVAPVDLEQHDAEHHERDLLRHALPPPDRERDEGVPRPASDLVHGELLRVEPVRLRAPVARVTLRGERPDQDDVVLPDPVAAERAVLEAAPDGDRHRRVDPHRLLDHRGGVRQRHQVVVPQVVVWVAAGDRVDLGDQLLLHVRVGGQHVGQPGGRDRGAVEAVGQVHEDLVADRLGVEELAGLRVRRADQPAEQVGLRPERAGVHPGADQRVGRPEQLGVVPAVGLAPRPPGSPGEQGEVGTGVGHPQDALLGARRDGRRERVRPPVPVARPGPGPVEQAEVVGARAAPGHLEGVPLHPGPRVQRLVVRQRGPRGDQLARLVLHPVQLRALVGRGVPGQHHPADLLVVLAVADHRETAAAGVGELGEEVDLLHPLAEPLLVRRHLVEQFGVRDHDQPPLLGRDPHRVDVAEPAVVVELGVVVVQDVEVREPLAPRHQPAHRVRDLERLAASAVPVPALGRAGAGPRGSPDPGFGHRVGRGRHLRLRRIGDLEQLAAGQPERGLAEADRVPLGQRRRGDPLLVDEGAVMAAQVHDAVSARRRAQFGVVTGDAEVGDHDVVVRYPADAPRLARVVEQRAVEQRPVLGIAQPDLALPVDLDQVRPAAVREAAVGAAEVGQRPAAAAWPELGMMPGHPDVGDHDVGLRIAADQVRAACRQAALAVPGPHHQRWRGCPCAHVLPPPRRPAASGAPPDTRQSR